ncbi:hypothetical protein LQ226_03040 [Pontibacillus sp. HN14]|nr:hypothetical protein [Pontibacillus sp. HN14]
MALVSNSNGSKEEVAFEDATDETLQETSEREEGKQGEQSEDQIKQTSDMVRALLNEEE